MTAKKHIVTLRKEIVVVRKAACGSGQKKYNDNKEIESGNDSSDGGYRDSEREDGESESHDWRARWHRRYRRKRAVLNIMVIEWKECSKSGQMYYKPHPLCHVSRREFSFYHILPMLQMQIGNVIERDTCHQNPIVLPLFWCMEGYREIFRVWAEPFEHLLSTR
jgi:hypothetical protein